MKQNMGKGRKCLQQRFTPEAGFVYNLPHKKTLVRQPSDQHQRDTHGEQNYSVLLKYRTNSDQKCML